LDKFTKFTQTLESDELQDIKHIIKTEVFRTYRISNKYDYFVKEVLNPSTLQITEVKFKGIPAEHFAICYKHYYKMELDERDLRIGFDPETQTYIKIDVTQLKLV